jgi:hypothetical protein
MDPLRAGADLADTPLGPIRVLASTAGIVALVFKGLNDLEDDGVTPPLEADAATAAWAATADRAASRRRPGCFGAKAPHCCK